MWLQCCLTKHGKPYYSRTFKHLQSPSCYQKYKSLSTYHLNRTVKLSKFHNAIASQESTVAWNTDSGEIWWHHHSQEPTAAWNIDSRREQLLTSLFFHLHLFLAIWKTGPVAIFIEIRQLQKFYFALPQKKVLLCSKI